MDSDRGMASAISHRRSTEKKSLNGTSVVETISEHQQLIRLREIVEYTLQFLR